MKSPHLTAQEAYLIEEIIATYGPVVTFDQIAAWYADEKRQQLRNRISNMVAKGWLLRLKKGLYAVCDISTRGTLPFTPFAVPNLFVSQSYISFEGALQHHGMYDQLLAIIRSVSLRRYSQRRIAGTTFQFIATQPQYYDGWASTWFGPLEAKITTPEKALIDLLQFHRKSYTVDLVMETLKSYEQDIDRVKLLALLEKAPLTVQRIMGFLWEQLGYEEDADAVHELVRGRSSRSHMTGESMVYVSRWRLYIDEYFQKSVVV